MRSNTNATTAIVYNKNAVPKSTKQHAAFSIKKNFEPTSWFAHTSDISYTLSNLITAHPTCLLYIACILLLCTYVMERLLVKKNGWKHIPGSVARPQTFSTESMVCSFGAWSTMVVEPTMQSTQPTIPSVCNRSLSTMCAKAALQLWSPPYIHIYKCSAKILSSWNQVKLHKWVCSTAPSPKTTSIIPYLTMMLSAPRGVTRTAGANAYAVKLATSPTSTAIIQFHSPTHQQLTQQKTKITSQQSCTETNSSHPGRRRRRRRISLLVIMPAHHSGS